jgi:hypothetical protein
MSPLATNRSFLALHKFGINITVFHAVSMIFIRTARPEFAKTSVRHYRLKRIELVCHRRRYI